MQFRDVLKAESLRERCVHFQIINMGIDTTTDIGKVVYGVLALFAEFKLSNLKRRTREGLQAARKRLGRPPALTSEQVAHARAQIDSGTETIGGMAFTLRRRSRHPLAWPGRVAL